MSEAKANLIREKAVAGLGGALLLAALVAAYANHFHNSFHFDDAHTIVNNASIRELRNIPLFFTDATTFSSLPSNQSYRPLVSTLLAIDFRLGGIQPFWFHVSILALFVALTLLVAFVIYRLLQGAGISLTNRWIALAAAAWYGLHPANADTVNYIIASSEVISTFGVIASFAAYLAFPQLRRYYFYVLPVAIAILAKPTAAIFAPLFAMYWLLFEQNKARVTETRLQRIGRMIVPFLICAAMLLFVQHMTPHSWVAGAANARNYLITQPCALVLLLCASGYATFQRNKVWKTEEMLWHDVVLKSPRNGRGLMNYGNTLMAKGDYEGALDYFHRAERLTPQYSVLLINLAIAEDATKQSAAAEQHFKDALRLAPASPDSYTYYARYLLSRSRAQEARAFLRSALELSPTDLTARELMAQMDCQTINEATIQTPES